MTKRQVWKMERLRLRSLELEGRAIGLEEHYTA